LPNKKYKTTKTKNMLKEKNTISSNREMGTKELKAPMVNCSGDGQVLSILNIMTAGFTNTIS
jgi:hypothetical protein